MKIPRKELHYLIIVRVVKAVHQFSSIPNAKFFISLQYPQTMFRIVIIPNHSGFFAVGKKYRGSVFVIGSNKRSLNDFPGRACPYKSLQCLRPECERVPSSQSFPAIVLR